MHLIALAHVNTYKFRKVKKRMEKVHEISDREKELLNALGKSPDISMKELLHHTPYKQVSTIVKKIEQLSKEHILFGPSYYLDTGKLCRNILYKLFCIIETHQKLETVLSYLKLIESFAWIFPVLSPRKNTLIAGFYSSDNAEMTSLFELLKDRKIITDYVIRPSRRRRIMENPNYFGDPVPPLDNLLNPCDITDCSYGHHDTEWNECDITLLPYFLTGYKNAKLIEILKKERKLNRTWTYGQISYSHKKMVNSGLIKKEYAASPFPYHRCVHFILFLKARNPFITQRMICNFARGERVYREYLFFEEWGLVECISHPAFVANLMNELDSIDDITEKELYHVRSLLPEKYWLNCPPEFKYFNFDEQTLKYPYHLYREKIKEQADHQ